MSGCSPDQSVLAFHHDFLPELANRCDDRHNSRDPLVL
jgi:hypothetical protein